MALPFSSAFAASESSASQTEIASDVYVVRANENTVFNGVWDYVGRRTTSSSENPTNYVYSTGGDFKFKVVSGPSGGAWYALYEYDPDNADDHVRDLWFYLYPGDEVIYRDIGNYVDGSNKKAEFYVRENFSGSATVDYWD
ncbi:hypothetical protein [Hazenella coriacea]|uniref:hypothetical protein n=1 Tax=Hazenella coriacea TaxID=1179467 RepID=UPI001FB51699|nr:hypothetical protein [Hazenella coriacea]